jgi:ComF family protein
VLKVFLNLLFPRKCVICHRELDTEDICDSCLANIPVFNWISCIRCGQRLEENQKCPSHRYRTPIAAIGVATDYQRTDIRALIHTYKYRGRKTLAKPLAELLIRHATQGGFEKLLEKNQATVIPIPLTKKRERQRGFNQSALIAELFAKHFNLPYRPHLLLRPIERKPQVKMIDVTSRRENIKGVFLTQDSKYIRNRNLVLIDDVASSGATLEEAARTLKEAGASNIWAMVIARGS